MRKFNAWLSVEDSENIYISAMDKVPDEHSELLSIDEIVKDGMFDMDLELMKRWKKKFESLVELMDKRIRKEEFGNPIVVKENDMNRETDVHTEHCCSIHGCKYNDPNCSVTTGKRPQSFPCESCDYEMTRVGLPKAKTELAIWNMIIRLIDSGHTIEDIRDTANLHIASCEKLISVNKHLDEDD